MDTNKAGFGSKEAASMGGKARKDALTTERLKEIGRDAIRARWEKAHKVGSSGTSKDLTVRMLPISTSRYSGTPGPKD